MFINLAMYRREAYALRRRSGDCSPQLLPAVYGSK